MFAGADLKPSRVSENEPRGPEYEVARISVSKDDAIYGQQNYGRSHDNAAPCVTAVFGHARPIPSCNNGKV